jgi:integrase
VPGGRCHVGRERPNGVGVRGRGEALALQWSDVDLDKGMLHIRGTLARIDGQLAVTEPKTAKSKRFVPISAPAERLLRALRAVQAEERRRAGSARRHSGFVFTTPFGEPCDPRNALRALKVVAARAGLPDTGLHTLRHSAASVMLTSGVPLKVVSEDPRALVNRDHRRRLRTRRTRRLARCRRQPRRRPRQVRVA